MSKNRPAKRGISYLQGGKEREISSTLLYWKEAMRSLAGGGTLPPEG